MSATSRAASPAAARGAAATGAAATGAAADPAGRQASRPSAGSRSLGLPMSDRLRRRLGELMRARFAGGREEPAPPGSVASVPTTTTGAPRPAAAAGDMALDDVVSRVPVELEGMLPGHEVTTARGPVYVHDVVRDASDPGYGRLLAEFQEATGRLALVADGEIEPSYAQVRERGIGAVVFLDLETGGLGGQPVFLAGLLRVRSRGFHLRQILVRSYAEEPALIEMVRRELDGVPVIVTYNGKAFDLPLLADRARYHGQVFEYDGLHLDLLHLARRRYRDRYPNCRLVTLEWFVCHRRRQGDVPGAEVPGRFHLYLRDGNPAPLIPVLHHNALDLVTLAELFGHLAPRPPGPRFVPDWNVL